MLNNNLGNVFVALGEGETDTAHFSQAIASYRAALAAVSFESNPLNHAYIQVSLGEALLKFAERDRDAAATEEAIAAFRTAEEIYAAHDGSAELAAETRRSITTAEALRAGLKQ